jgi:protein SCO1/2
MLRRWLPAALLALCACVQAAPALKGATFTPARAAPEIAMKAADGSDFALSKQRGKVVVLEFGYTTCADVCPVSLATLAQAHKQLGPDAGKLQVVFVTVDPARDKPEVLREYLAKFDKSFVGITGSPAQVQAILAAYGIGATKKMVEGSKTDYTMHHSSYLYFIDPKGMQRSLLLFGRPAADVVHDVKLLLQ